MFQDVHAGGAAAIAGLEPGDILLRVDGQEITPPDHAVFPMGSGPASKSVDKCDVTRTAYVNVARPKGKKLPLRGADAGGSPPDSDRLGYLEMQSSRHGWG